MSSLGDHALGFRDIVTKRDRRLLDDEHLIAGIRKDVVGALPPRPIDEGASGRGQWKRFSRPRPQGRPEPATIDIAASAEIIGFITGSILDAAAIAVR